MFSALNRKVPPAISFSVMLGAIFVTITLYLVNSAANTADILSNGVDRFFEEEGIKRN